jgi:zinc transport system permease protein
MTRAFIAGCIIGAIAPAIGAFLVVRRYSLMADTLAHVSLAGVAIGLLLKLNPLLTAIVTSVIAAIGIERLRSVRKLYGESILALFLTGSLAIATVIIGLAQGFTVNLFSYLFGSITTVTSQDIVVIASVGIVMLLTLVLFYKELFFVALDEELAQTHGLPVKLINILLVVMAALTVSLSIRIVGVLLIGALMVIPVITALQYGGSFKQTIGLSIVFSLLSVIAGLFLSYYLNIASGGTIILVALAAFILTLVFIPAEP